MAAVKAEPKCEPTSPAGNVQAGPSTSVVVKRKADTEDTQAAKKAKTNDGEVAPLALQPGDVHTKCPDFWYLDGNVVILVRGTVFKLYKARLSKYCAVLAARFAEDDGASQPTIEGCPVYEVENLSVDEFKQFLEALETPFVFASNAPTQATSISILRASHVLDCPDMRAFAIEKLRAAWPHDKPNLPGGRRSPNLAIRIIQVSRECDVPDLRKRAFYELIRNPNVWIALAQNQAALKLPETDVIALLMAFQALQRLWFALVFEPPVAPGPDGVCRTCQGAKRGGVLRAAAWRNQMIEEGHFEAGRMDPIGYLEVLQTDKRKNLEGPTGWCGVCMQDRAKAWAEAQVKWWAKLDDWVKA